MTTKQPHGNTGNKHAVGHGRPRKSPQGRVQMQISVTAGQRAEIKRRAEQAGVTASAWLLERLDQ